MANKTRATSFLFDAKLTATVKGMAEKAGITRSALLRRAIALYTVVVQGQQRGEKLYVVDKDGKRTELILIP